MQTWFVDCDCFSFISCSVATDFPLQASASGEHDFVQCGKDPNSTHCILGSLTATTFFICSSAVAPNTSLKLSQWSKLRRSVRPNFKRDSLQTWFVDCDCFSFNLMFCRIRHYTIGFRSREDDGVQCEQAQKSTNCNLGSLTATPAFICSSAVAPDSTL